MWKLYYVGFVINVIFKVLFKFIDRNKFFGWGLGFCICSKYLGGLEEGS